ncbi:MAG: MotA/TolQ/ExbB proton channel family protein [Alphaproteobacteria bacterium]|nr:MotA/TolQ/ExbB proton channel family protein [Alphaproteobacteria bacterium]
MLQEMMMAFALRGAGWVLWLLVALSVLCIAISLERVYYLITDGTPRIALQAIVDKFLKGGSTSEFQDSLAKLKGFEARVLSAGVEMRERGPEAAERAMSGVATAEKISMERGLAVLATVGSNAPFLGLFGTVLGIIQAFADLAESNAEASEAVMSGISEALVATAVGLMVAIPAVVLYNSFARWVKGRIGRSESLSQLVVARLIEPEHVHGK